MIFWNIIIAIAAYALQLVLAPKPQNAKPKSLEDFSAPTAEEGREIPVGFGTVDFADPNVTWYGDLARKAIKGARRYGLFGPRQILGYKYSLGMQMGLCHGPADALFEIRVGDKEAWTGSATSGRITINKGDLFGGDQSEGGIEGDVDLCMGAPDQLQNDYLVTALGADVSAFRGVVTLVLRQVYLGTSAYIKPWAFRLQRIYLRSDGTEQWYPEKAGIPAPMDTTTGDAGLDLGVRLGDQNNWDTYGDYIVWEAPSAGNAIVWKISTGDSITIAREGTWLNGDRSHITGDSEVVLRQGSGGGGTFLKFYDPTSGSLTQSIEIPDTSQNVGFYMDDRLIGDTRWAMARTLTAGADDYLWNLLKKESGTWVLQWSEPGALESLETLSMGLEYTYSVPSSGSDTVVRVSWPTFAEDHITLPGFAGTIKNCNYNGDTDEVIVISNNGNIYVYTPDLSTLKRSATAVIPSGSVAEGSSKRMRVGGGLIGLFENNSGVLKIHTVRVTTLEIFSTIVVADTNFVEKSNAGVGDVGAIFNDQNGGILLPGASGGPSVFWLFSSTVLDMNPAHIIRECLTDKTWGMGYNDGDIDAASFTAAADTFYAEGFGLSLKWYREEEIQEFVKVIQSHVDAYLYLSRSTGKYVLKPIRNDYDIDTIDVVDEDDVIEWTEVLHRKPSEAVSAVVVKFYNRDKRKDGSHTVTNIAQAMQAGTVISTPREYPGINYSSLAIRVGARDVISLGSGMASGRLKVKRTLEHLNPGDPFRLVGDRHRLAGEVMRVADLGFGDGRNNQIILKFVQDVFNLGAEVLVDTSPSDWENPSNPPEPASPRLVWEMPYRELRQMVGDPQLATMLAGDPDAGLLQLSGTRPTADALNAIIDVDSGAGFVAVDTLEFAPGGVLNGALAIDGTSINVDGDHDLDDVTVGSLASIDGLEVVRIDAIAGSTFTIARGCLDTVPVAHADGAAVVFFDDFSLSDFEVYTAADDVSVRLLTVTGIGTLSLGSAPTDTVTMDSRAIRPLRPADAKVEGDDGFGGAIDVGALDPFEVTWANRNRLIEMAPLAWTDPDAGLESGATITIALIFADGTTIIDDTTYAGLTGTSANIDHADFLGESEVFVRFTTERDGYGPWQAYQIAVALSALLLLEGDMTDGDDNLLLEGDMTDGNDLLRI